jgi:hydrogenase maturation protease HycI
MLPLCWQEPLRTALHPKTANSARARVAVVGVGNELRGDDGAGPMVARLLAEAVGGQDGLLIVDGGSAPENSSGLLRRFAPDLVLLVDAAEAGDSPGAVRWIDCAAAGGGGPTTHTLPLRLLSAYLHAELGCRVVLLGIQPADLSLDAPLSGPVRAAVDTVAQALAAALREWAAA